MEADYAKDQGWNFVLGVQPGQKPGLSAVQDHIGTHFNVPAASGLLDADQFDFKSLNLAFAVGGGTEQVTFDFAGAMHFSAVDIDFNIHFMLKESNG